MSAEELFKALRAKAEAAGLTLVRTDPADGYVRYFVIRRLTVRELHNPDDVEALVNHLQPRH